MLLSLDFESLLSITGSCKLRHLTFSLKKKMLPVVVNFKTSNFHYTRVFTPKRVTGGRAHLRGLASGNSALTSKRWRTVGESVRFDRAGNRIQDLLRK